MTYIPAQALPLTAFGDLRTAEISPVFQYSYEYTVDNTELNSNGLVNGGTVTQADGMAVVGTSTTTASSAYMESKSEAKYKAGLGGLGRFTTLFETGGVAATEQYVGLRSAQGSSAAFTNGYVVGFDGTTFGFHRFQNDVKFSVNQANWDDPLDGTGASGMTLNISKLNVWEIRFRTGGGAIDLFVEDDSTGRFVLAHTVLYANVNTSPSVYMPNFHLTVFADNKATTSDLVIKTASMAYFVEGKTEPTQVQQPQQTSDVQTKAGVTTEVAIFTIRNKATYASKTNHIEVLLENVTGSIEAGAANNLGGIRIVQNATLGGTPSYNDINTSDSIVDIDIAGTTVTGGKELFSSPLAGKNDRIGANLITYKILISSGDTVTIAGLSAASATINASLLWKELF